MKCLVYLLLCFCVVQSFVDSGVILEKISSGLSQAKQGVKCGLHKIGNTFKEHQHENDPCQNEAQFSIPAIDVRGPEWSSTESSSGATVPRGKRIISVGSNCPPGYRDDGKGNCREDY